MRLRLTPHTNFSCKFFAVQMLIDVTQFEIQALPENGKEIGLSHLSLRFANFFCFVFQLQQPFILRCQNLILANWANMSVNSFSGYQIAWITGDQSFVVKHSYAQLVAQFVASEGSRATKPGCIQEIQIQTQKYKYKITTKSTWNYNLPISMKW